MDGISSCSKLQVGLPLSPATVPPLRPSVPGGVGHALTVAVRIKPGHRDVLSKQLTTYDRDIRGCKDIVFAALTTVHFMRWVIVETTSDGGAGTLLFESNHDGTIHAHLDDLLRAGAPGLHAIYQHCEDYPAELGGSAAPEAFKNYLIGRTIPHSAFHVGAHGKSVAQIRVEAEVRSAIGDFLDQRRRVSDWPISRERLHAEIVRHVIARGLLAKFHDEAPLAPRVQRGRLILALAALAAPYLPLLPLLPAALWLLRYKERHDREGAYGTASDGINRLAEREDRLTQNQLSHSVLVKNGPFRRWLLRIVLRAIDIVARFESNQGSLGGITTIHFARWVILDDGRRLVFFSNYDGSWESYLGDFIDKSAVGLTAIWSNTIGFPRTKWLIAQGARAENRFKAWTRDHQIETQLWYSAYPDLTVRNILQNQRICRGLIHPPTGAELREWCDSL